MRVHKKVMMSMFFIVILNNIRLNVSFDKRHNGFASARTKVGNRVVAKCFWDRLADLLWFFAIF